VLGSLALVASLGACVPRGAPCGGPTIRFAVIGDYGLDGPAEAEVAALVRGWAPDFVITLGDNNYPAGAAATIDANVGKHYATFIAPYAGAHGPGRAENAFFPALGNHDWDTAGAAPYLSYFSALPGNGRYYDFVRGHVHLFALDSDPREPDGIGADSVQARWLRERLLASTARWKVVYLHHAPYSSSSAHGSSVELQWPYGAWGASAVLAGHDHTYERLRVGGLPYLVNGLGGAPRYDFGTPLPESQVRHAASHGAQLVVADAGRITFRFHDAGGAALDVAELRAPGCEAGVPATP